MGEKISMKKLLMLAAVFLLLLGPALAVEPIGSGSYQAWVGVEQADFSGGAPYIRLKASYTSDTIVSSGAGNGVGGQGGGDVFRTESKPLAGAILALTFDGQILTDKNGQPVCQNLLTASQSRIDAPAPGRSGIAVDAGEVVCWGSGPFYARDPDPNKGGAPRLLTNWTGCGMLQVKLVSSPDQAFIQTVHAPAMMYCPSQPRGLSIYNLLGLGQLSPALIGACLPIFLVLGLLMASMYQRGRDPLMLFDITTPRLPTMRKVRMKPVTQPFHLATKARMATRVINRSERAIGSSLFALYGGKAAGKAAHKARERAAAILAMQAEMKNGKKEGDTERYRRMVEQMHKLIYESNASDAQKERAWAAAIRLIQVREAMIIDTKAQSYTRFPEAGFSSKVNAAVTKWGPVLAKPWKLLPGMRTNEKADWLPGIPYVERTGMVISGWLASRAGNIALRRQIRNTALAEVGVATGMLSRDSKFAKAHAFENKRLGHIPHIVEKMRNESYILGRAIMDEHLRALMTAAALEQEKDGNFKMNDVRVRDMLKMAEKAQRDATKDGVVDQLKMRLLLGQQLAAYVQNNKITIYNAMGEVLDKDARNDFLKQFSEHMSTAYDTLKRDGQATRDGLLPLFNDEARKMNPNEVYARYNQLVGLTTVYAKEASAGAAKGFVPMVYLGHDLAELLGRSVSMQHLKGQITVLDEGHRLMHIRIHMEEEMMRRQLFEYVIGEKKLGKAGGREGSAEWIKELKSALSVDNIRSQLDYAKRSEWAARNYLTGYNANAQGYSAEAERNKIEIIRQVLAFSTGHGYETLFRNYWTQVERNNLTYLTMKETSKFYTGQEWNAEGYEAWKKRGVTYGDVQRGVWFIGGERVLTPLPSGVYRDMDGRIVGAFLKRDGERVDYRGVRTQLESKMVDGKSVYEHSAYSLLMSDYADRPINLSLLFRTRDEKTFKPGSPMDRETRILSHQLQAAWAELTGPAYGVSNLARFSKDEERKRFLKSLEDAGGMAEARISGRELGREHVLANIRKIENMLFDHVQMTTRSSLKDDPNQKLTTRFGSRATQFLERVMRGGTTETDERLHQWYASQAYARVVIQSYAKDAFSEKLYSSEVQDSLNAKKELGRLRGEQLDLLKQTHLSMDQQQKLAQLRTDISKQMQEVQRLEQASRDYQKNNSYVDRQLKRVADLWLPFYNVAEQTNMRDPRIAAGGGYAMGPAMMVGYQTGQFVGERPQMWAGYALNPGDRMLNILARPSQWAAIAFGSHTRTFFTKMTGYTTVYHVDPERGISGTNTHEQGVVEAFQSLFKPSQSFDWLTRLNIKPVVRGFSPSKYKNEFGWDVSEENSWYGKTYNWPVTFKGSGTPKSGTTESLSSIDANRYAMMGMDLGVAKRQTKPGMSFREEYTVWNQRDKAQMESESRANIEAMRERLNTIKDPTERRLLQYQIREAQDVADTTRRMWNIPGMGAFFRQGYYGVENRAGYDIAASGGSHRPWEMLAPYHKNVDGAWVPGMLELDRAGNLQLFPRLARTISGSWMGSGEAMYTGKQKGAFGTGGERHATSPLSQYEKLEYGVGMGGSAEKGYGIQDISQYGTAYMTGSGSGRDLFRDALRDTYRRETPLLPKMLDLEMQRQSWSFQNSEYVIPLAPLYLGIYHIWRHSSKTAREQSWNRDAPNERDYGELTADEKRQTAVMRERMMRAGDSTYSCPTHGIILRGGQACPLCRSEEALKAEKENTFLKRVPARKFEQMKDWGRSWMSLGTGMPGYYTHYMDQAHCSIHQVGYPRGTACPLCMEKQVKASRSDAERRQMLELDSKLKGYAKEIDSIYGNRRLSELERGRKIAEVVDKREETVQKMGISFERDTRMGFSQGRAYLQAEMERLKEEEKKHNYKIK